MDNSPPPCSFRFTLTLFLAFLRLGLTAFGGPAMVAYIRDLATKKYQWLSEDSFKQGVAICQVIPGATAMQVAAYVGLRSGGAFGAIAAYVGFGLPAFLLMVSLAILYQNAHDQATVVAIFHGLQLIIIALVANAALNFGKGTIKNWRDGLFGTAVMLFLVLHGDPFVAILASSLVGIVFYRNEATGPKGVLSTDSVQMLSQLRIPLAITACFLAGMVVLFVNNRQLFDLSLVMAKVDLFAFGGGYGSVPIMFNEVVGKRLWLDGKTFLDGMALGQITPGPIVITATYVGYLLSSLPGALFATIGIFTPSLIILTLAVPFFDRIKRNELFQRGMQGILVSFVGLLLSVTITFIMTVQWGVPQASVAILAFIALRMKVDILWVVLAGAIISILLF
ncbi:MAG: chromate efflux transporter [Desulfobulbaceae bacterium]|nr:MAG: chromate efflux transporter [Desulfobulbaceae bacterium]